MLVFQQWVLFPVAVLVGVEGLGEDLEETLEEATEEDLEDLPVQEEEEPTW